MQKQEKPKKSNIKVEISGSETFLEKLKKKIPWIFGTWIRKPKYFLPKLKIRKRGLPIPASSLNFIITFIILFVLQTGIFYLILRESPALGIDANENPIFIYPENIHEAFTIESIVASSLILLYSSGFLLLYQASKHVYNKKIAIWYLIIAIILISICFVLLQQMLNVKIPKPINSS